MRLLVVIPLVFAVACSGAEPVASQITWKEHFGSNAAEPHALYSLMANGYLLAASANVDAVRDEWLKQHANATVKPVHSHGPFSMKDASSNLVYVWVTEGTENLNIELVRRGCLAPETQFLRSDDQLLVPRDEYEAIVRRIKAAGEFAKKEHLGLWSVSNPRARSVAESHLQAHVPAPADFRAFFIRDVSEFLSQKAGANVVAEYELLREGPTQTGVAFPKFYAWVRAIGDDKAIRAEGAIRLAAIEKKRFQITDFLTKEEIVAQPSRIEDIFPRALAPGIRARAGIR